MIYVNDNECIICLESILYYDFITSSHGNTEHPYGYHLACWLKYRKTSNRCPYCREKLSIMLPEISYIEISYIEIFMEILMTIINKFDYNKPIQFIAIEFLTICITIINSANGIELLLEIIKNMLIFCLTCTFMNGYIHLHDPMSFIICLYCCYRMSNDLIDYIYFVYDKLLDESVYM